MFNMFIDMRHGPVPTLANIVPVDDDEFACRPNKLFNNVCVGIILIRILPKTSMYGLPFRLPMLLFFKLFPKLMFVQRHCVATCKKFSHGLIIVIVNMNLSKMLATEQQRVSTYKIWFAQVVNPWKRT